MFRNYLVVAFRNFWKKKVFSFINIAGLAIGISAALVIYLIVHYEFSFDKFEKDRGRIYRVVSIMHFPNQLFRLSGSPMPLISASRELTGIETTAPFLIYGVDKTEIRSGGGQANTIFKKQPSVIFADGNYFKLLSYQWVAGNAGLMKEPFKLVLTESRVKTYFRNPSDAIGKTIIYDDSLKVTIAGIVKDLDQTTDFNFKEFISYSTIFATNIKYNFGWDQWGSINSVSQFFIKLSQGVKQQNIEKQLADLRARKAKDNFMQTDYKLQPLSDVHFNADYDNFNQRQGHKPTLYGLLLVAAFLLLLGCINFVNLATAQAVQRAREIGIRKTMGSSKLQLVFQFLSETFLITLIATILSIALVPWILHIFSDFIPPGLQFNITQQPHIIIFLALLVMTVTVASGFYPSLVLSRYKPVLVLKNQAFANTGKTRKAWLRKTLTVSQFVIAQFFIITTMIVGHQIRFALHKDLGYKKDAIINFYVPFSFNNPQPEKAKVLLNKLKEIPGVQAVAFAGNAPASANTSFTTMKFKNDKKDVDATVQLKNADSDYFKLYNMKLLAGRFPLPSDSLEKEYVVNENYTRFLGYKNPEDILGKTVERGDKKIPIVGVLADFHYQSLHSSIQPLAYSAVNKNKNIFHVALSPKNGNNDAWKNTISQIEKVYKELYPEKEFDYKFFDESIAEFYKTERDTSRLLTWATGLCIFISCLGLLGLVIYTTNLRTKEIGVRKVLGASVSQIVSLLSKDFISLVIIAFVIAAPAAWWAMHKWLEDFAYRAAISWWIFGLSGAAMIMLALLTLSIQTIRSAMANPVKSLRTE